MKFLNIKKIKISLLLLLCAFVSNFMVAQTVETVKIEDYLSNRQFYIFDENIKSVVLNKGGWSASLPVIKLNSRDRLYCSFDDFDDYISNYSYTVVHCDPNWKQTENIQQNEYLSGYYFYDDIRDYSSSFNTLQPYNNYTFVFPNDYINFAYSGNYALIVYKDTPEEPSFIARFYVCEDRTIDILAKTGNSRNPLYKQMKQKVDVTLDCENFHIYDPYSSLVVLVQQNNRTYNIQSCLKPRNISGNKLIYNYDDVFEFNGNNEFRLADLKTFKFLTRSMYDIQAYDRKYHIVLTPEETFKHRTYTSAVDLNGSYEIFSQDALTDSNNEAEYGTIYFTLVDPSLPMPNKEVYICGDFNGWDFNEENKMVYNYEKGFYEGELFLKQGYYNYTYIIKDKATNAIDDTEMDGNFFETKNQYNIYVYYIGPGDYHYRLIGLSGVQTQ